MYLHSLNIYKIAIVYVEMFMYRLLQVLKLIHFNLKHIVMFLCTLYCHKK